jgi:hypothetical protein
MPAPALETQAKLWMTSVCAIPTALTRATPRHDLLGGAPKCAETTRMTATLLASSWNVHDVTSLRATLARLGDAGLRSTRRKNRESVSPSKPTLARDYVHLVAIAGWGYLADYISEDEAWAIIAPAAKRLAESYPSWRDLGRAFLRETEACDPRSSSHCEMVLEALLTESTSPWRNVPWETPLAPTGRARAKVKAVPRIAPYVVVMLATAVLLAWLHRGSSARLDRRPNAIGLIESPDLLR